MKKYLLLFVLLFILIFTNCMNKETQINLNKDGSGILIIKMTMTKEMIQFFNEIDEETENEIQNPFDKEKFQEMIKEMGNDIDLLSYEEINNSEISGGIGTYSFKDINNLQLLLTPKTDFEETNEKLIIRFKFNNNDSISSLTIIPPEISQMKNESKMSKEKIKNGIDTFSFFLKKLYIKFSIIINGEIISANIINCINNNECILADLDVKEILKSEEEIIKLLTSDNIEEIKLLINKINGLKIEIEKEIKIEFK